MADLGVLNRQVQEYDQGLEDYQRGAQQYTADVNKYNAAVEKYNAPYGAYWEYQRNVAKYNKMLATLQRERARLSEAASLVRYPEQGAVVAGWIDTFNRVTLPEMQAKMAALNVDKAPELGMAKPEFTAQAPTAPSLTNQQLAALQGRQSVAEQSMTDTAENQGLIARMQGRTKPDSIIGGLLQNARYST